MKAQILGKKIGLIAILSSLFALGAMANGGSHHHPHPSNPGYGYGGPGYYPVPPTEVNFEKTCESQSEKYHECATKVQIVDLEVYRQLSQADCIKGKTFGRVGNRIWVDDGCRAQFVVYGLMY